MIGAAAAVLGDAPAELAKGQRQHLLVVAVRGEIVVEGADRLGELAEQAVLRRLLTDVRVERAVLHVEHARADIAAGDLRGEREAASKRRRGIGRVGLIAGDEFGQLLRAALRVIFDLGDVREIRRCEREADCRSPVRYRCASRPRCDR